MQDRTKSAILKIPAVDNRRDFYTLTGSRARHRQMLSCRRHRQPLYSRAKYLTNRLVSSRRRRLSVPSGTAQETDRRPGRLRFISSLPVLQVIRL